MPRRTLDDVFDDADDFGLLNVSAPVVRSGSDEADKVARKLAAFIEKHGRAPDDMGEAGLKERLLAADVSRHASAPSVAFVLGTLTAPQSLDDILDSDLIDDGGSIFEMVHVSARASAEQPEYIGSRKPCEDFETFKPIFDLAVKEVESGARQTLPFAKEQEIRPGQFFVVKGMLSYVASAGEPFKDRLGNTNRRLRVIYDNGTEADPLLRSFSSRLYSDENGRRLSDPSAGPLFDTSLIEGERTGTIYLARSLSEHPDIRAHAGRLLKLGVTTGKASDRIKGAEKDPTFLLAPVTLVASFALENVDPHGLENVLHRFFDPARADATISGIFGHEVRPREWFFIDAESVRFAVQLISDGRLGEYQFNPKIGQIEERALAATVDAPSA